MKHISLHAIKVALMLSAVALVSACVGDGQAVKTETNVGGYAPEFLFEAEGCKAYRFNDNGTHVYYVNCGQTTTTHRKVSCGKNCTKPMNVVTRREE